MTTASCRYSKILGKSLKVVETEKHSGDPPILVGSAEKARKILKWQPKWGTDFNRGTDLNLSPQANGFRWAILQENAPLYWPGFSVSMITALFFLLLGIRFFRKTERSFADII